MNDHEKDRIAASLHQLRPDWPVKSIRTLLDRPQLTGRHRRDVAVALTWVACEPRSATPARVLEAGPWWRAVSVDGTTQPLDVAPVGSRCTTCGEQRDRCRLLWTGDHEFTPPIPRDVDLAPVVAELKDHIRPPAPSTEETETDE